MGTGSLLQGDLLRQSLRSCLDYAGSNSEGRRSCCFAARARSTWRWSTANTTRLCCVSAPVFDEKGTSVASLTVALLSAQVTDERIEKMKRHVRNTAQNLSKERGYFEDRFPEAALAS